MKQSTNKLRFVVESQLAHIDPTILNFLLRHSHLANSEDVAALAKTLLIEVLDNAFADDEGVGASDWGARIRASLRKGEEEDDEFLADGRQAEPFIPQEVRIELEGDLQRASKEVRKLQSMRKRELDKAYAAACEVRLRTTKELPEAVWNVWLAKPSWTIEETVALLFGKDPSDLHATSKDLPDWARSAFAAKLDHLKRLVGAGVLKDPTTPQFVQEWVSKHGLPAPVELQLAKAEEIQNPAVKNEGDIHHLTLKLLQHTLLYLAVVHHGYDPAEAAKGKAAGKPAKSRAPKSISVALIRAGFKGSDRAIRDNLSKAVEAFRAEYGDAALKKLAKHRKLPSTKL